MKLRIIDREVCGVVVPVVEQYEPGTWVAKMANDAALRPGGIVPVPREALTMGRAEREWQPEKVLFRWLLGSPLPVAKWSAAAEVPPAVGDVQLPCDVEPSVDTDALHTAQRESDLS